MANFVPVWSVVLWPLESADKSAHSKPLFGVGLQTASFGLIRSTDRRLVSLWTEDLAVGLVGVRGLGAELDETIFKSGASGHCHHEWRARDCVPISLSNRRSATP